MAFEKTMIDLLGPLVGNRIWWDSLPEGMPLPTQIFIILQQVGGKSSWYLEKENMPSHKHARLQVSVWGTNRLAIAPLQRTIENTIALSPLVAEVYGAPIGAFSGDIALKGSHQQFGIWFPDP